MIRRTFLKALMGGPLGFLIPKETSEKTCCVLHCDSPTVDKLDCWCLCDVHYMDALSAAHKRLNTQFRVFKDGKGHKSTV